MSPLTVRPERSLTRTATIANLRSAIAKAKAVQDAARATANAIAAGRAASSEDQSGDGSGSAMPAVKAPDAPH